MFPPDNGFKRWVGRCVDRGKKMLIMGGCTLNSCVRVSSIETQKKFKNSRVQVAVDLSMCGARAGNFIASSNFNGLSAVESAVKQMRGAGVLVAGRIDWD